MIGRDRRRTSRCRPLAGRVLAGLIGVFAARRRECDRGFGQTSAIRIRDACQTQRVRGPGIQRTQGCDERQHPAFGRNDFCGNFISRRAVIDRAYGRSLQLDRIGIRRRHGDGMREPHRDRRIDRNIPVPIPWNGGFEPKARSGLQRRGLHAKRRGGGIEDLAITQRAAEPALSARKPHAAIGKQLRRLVLARTSQVQVRWNLLFAPRVQQFRRIQNCAIRRGSTGDQDAAVDEQRRRVVRARR